MIDAVEEPETYIPLTLFGQTIDDHSKVLKSTDATTIQKIEDRAALILKKTMSWKED